MRMLIKSVTVKGSDGNDYKVDYYQDYKKSASTLDPEETREMIRSGPMTLQVNGQDVYSLGGNKIMTKNRVELTLPAE